LLVPRRVPHVTITSSPNAKPSSSGRQIGKGGEVSLVSRSGCGATLDTQIEGHRLEITVLHERGHDRVEVSGSFGLPVLLKQAEHLISVHSPILLCAVMWDSRIATCPAHGIGELDACRVAV
jgi:hypothetical protein